MKRQNQGENECGEFSLEELMDRLAAVSEEGESAEALEQEILARAEDDAAFFPNAEEQWAVFQALYLPMAQEDASEKGSSLQLAPVLAEEASAPVPGTQKT